MLHPYSIVCTIDVHYIHMYIKIGIHNLSIIFYHIYKSVLLLKPYRFIARLSVIVTSGQIANKLDFVWAAFCWVLYVLLNTQHEKFAKNAGNFYRFFSIRRPELVENFLCYQRVMACVVGGEIEIISVSVYQSNKNWYYVSNWLLLNNKNMQLIENNEILLDFSWRKSNCDENVLLIECK